MRLKPDEVTKKPGLLLWRQVCTFTSFFPLPSKSKGSKLVLHQMGYWGPTHLSGPWRGPEKGNRYVNWTSCSIVLSSIVKYVHLSSHSTLWPWTQVSSANMSKEGLENLETQTLWKGPTPPTIINHAWQPCLPVWVYALHVHMCHLDLDRSLDSKPEPGSIIL